MNSESKINTSGVNSRSVKINYYKWKLLGYKCENQSCKWWIMQHIYTIYAKTSRKHNKLSI